MWRDYPMVLRQRLRRTIISYDRLGFGQSTPRSDKISNDFIAEEANSVVRVLDALKVETAILFGYSVGGSMAVSTAAQAPDRIIAVISESAQAFVEQQTIDGVEIARKRFQDDEQKSRLRRWHSERTEWILEAWFDTWTSPSYADWSLAPLLPKVTCPLLVIHGDHDDYGSIAFPELITRLAGGESKMVIVENCGHVPHREHPERVLMEIESFLDIISK